MRDPIINPITNAFKKTKRKEPQIPYTYGSDVFSFYDSWINSPEYSKRLQNNQYENPNQTVFNRSDAINNLDVSFDSSGRSAANSPATLGAKARVNINREELNQLGIPVTTGLAHEVSHAIGSKQNWQNDVVGFNDYERDLIKNSITKTKPTITGSQNSPEYKQSSREYDNWKYLQKPEEVKADIDASRYNLFREGIFDIRKGEQFNQDYLNKAKETFKEDASFNRMLEQLGDENYIQLMNTIASNKQGNQIQAAYGGYVNPMNYSLGGFMNLASNFIPTQNKEGVTSVGGSAAKGALSGASAGAALGPIGMGVGAVLGGGISAIGAASQRKNELEQIQIQKNTDNREMLANMNYGVGQASNLPMAMGGSVNPVNDNPVGTFTSFEGGGTHEQNPNGGIPQGFNSNGQLRTVEANESSFKFKEDKYIFSDRLKYI